MEADCVQGKLLTTVLSVLFLVALTKVYRSLMIYGLWPLLWELAWEHQTGIVVTCRDFKARCPATNNRSLDKGCKISKPSFSPESRDDNMPLLGWLSGFNSYKSQPMVSDSVDPLCAVGRDPPKEELCTQQWLRLGGNCGVHSALCMLEIVLHFLAKGLKDGRQQCLISNPYWLASLILAWVIHSNVSNLSLWGFGFFFLK